MSTQLATKQQYMATSKLKARPPGEVIPKKPKILLYGPPGVGKTWFSLDFPQPYYIDTEGGASYKHYMDKLTKSGGQRMGPEDGSLDFATVIEQVQALATEKHGFGTLVLDSVTKLFNTSVANEAERLGDKDAFGASKKLPIAHMRRLVSWIQRLDMNVVLISHEKEEWGVNTKGDRVQIGKTFDCWDKLAYELDLTLAATKQGPSRYANVIKSRLQSFPDNERFPLDFAPFEERYGKEIIEKHAVPVVLASTEQVAEITRLLEVVKIDEKTIEKWKTAANAESFAEFTTEQADGVISHLNGKLNPAAK